MFCPNCGTQNPDTAQSCSKCSFNLKGAAAPKFKGTMLMMNQPTPGGTPAPGAAPMPGAPGAGLPGAAARSTGSGAPPGAVAPPSKLKGTMVGVAPMAGGFPGSMPGGPSPMGAPAPTPAPEAAPPVFSPPVQQQGVNPLGGTVAADVSSFAAAFGNAPAPQAAPPAPGGYGAPQGGAAPFAATTAVPAAYGAPPYGAPPPGYGPPQGYGGPQGGPPQGYGPPPGQQPGGYDPNAPPGGGYGAPPPGYGQQQQPGYGPPPGYPQPGPGGQYGSPPGYPMQAGPGAMQPYGQGAPMMGPGGPAGAVMGAMAGGSGPTRRNALMTMLLPLAVMVGGSILCTILTIVTGIGLFGLLQLLFFLGGAAWGLMLFIPMVNELKFVTKNEQLAWWPIFVPIYNYYWMWVVIPAEVTKAKQILGVQQPVRPIVLYIFLWPFALASDINDMVR